MGRERAKDFAERLPRLIPQEEADISHLSDEMADILYPRWRTRPYRMGISFEDAVRGAEREIELPNGKRLRVKIPAGVDSGAKLRFAGQGAQPGGDFSYWRDIGQPIAPALFT